MNARNPQCPSRVEWAIVGLILGSLTFCLWPIVRDARGPSGDPIPKQPPDEANRLHHPAGFSMVVPPRWSSHRTTDLAPFPEGMLMAPLNPGRYARRSRALITVSQLGDHRPSDLVGFRRTRIFGREAYEKMGIVREWTFDDGAWSEYLLYLRHDGRWYEVKYGIAEERTMLPGMVRQYIHTLRWKDGDDRPGAANAAGMPRIARP